MISPQVFKKWQREWAQIQRDFLDGKLPVPMITQVTSSPTDGYRWECPACDELGTPVKSSSRAEVAGHGHVRVHAAQEDLEELEKMKILRMPEELLTRYQRAQRDKITASEE